MSKFRCRLCEVVVEDPAEHIEVAHRIPLTMVEVWSQFTLVASSHYREKTPREKRLEVEVTTEPLF